MTLRLAAMGLLTAAIVLAVLMFRLWAFPEGLLLAGITLAVAAEVLLA